MSGNKEKTKTKMFVIAMKKASELNQQRYCALFGEPNLSFQVLDNPGVKEDYNKANCQ